MIQSGKVKTLMAGWAVAIPCNEVERLQRDAGV
jgi:hypothetical protein